MLCSYSCSKSKSISSSNNSTTGDMINPPDDYERTSIPNVTWATHLYPVHCRSLVSIGCTQCFFFSARDGSNKYKY